MDRREVKEALGQFEFPSHQNGLILHLKGILLKDYLLSAIFVLRSETLKIDWNRV